MSTSFLPLSSRSNWLPRRIGWNNKLLTTHQNNCRGKVKAWQKQNVMPCKKPQLVQNCLLKTSEWTTVNGTKSLLLIISNPTPQKHSIHPEILKIQTGTCGGTPAHSEVALHLLSRKSSGIRQVRCHSFQSPAGIHKRYRHTAYRHAITGTDNDGWETAEEGYTSCTLSLF